MQPEPPSWVNLLTLMVHGPTLPVHGRMRTVAGEDEAAGWFAWGGMDRPVIAGMRGAANPEATDWATPIRLWWDGVRLRVEEPDGAVDVIADADTCWQWEQGSDVPVTAARELLRLSPGAIGLLERRSADSFLDDDFTRPTGPVGVTNYLGRTAWTVELAPPSDKPHPTQLVVDAETGLVLQKRNDGFGFREEWIEFETAEHFDDALFRWDGAVREREIDQPPGRAEHEEDMARRNEWFEANVATLPIPLELAADVHIFRYEDDGAFEGQIGGMLIVARRPTSDSAWDLEWHAVDHRWSTDRWDWALQFDQTSLTERGLQRLKRHLGAIP